MHSWFGDFKYFEDVARAADYIGNFCARWGFIDVMQTKEKFGTARVYINFGICRVTHPILSKVNPILLPFQEYIYRLAYHKAITRYPHIRTEILEGADYPCFLGGL